MSPPVVLLLAPNHVRLGAEKENRRTPLPSPSPISEAVAGKAVVHAHGTIGVSARMR
jgi:hypothetical protein